MRRYYYTDIASIDGSKADSYLNKVHNEHMINKSIDVSYWLDKTHNNIKGFDNDLISHMFVELVVHAFINTPDTDFLRDYSPWEFLQDNLIYETNSIFIDEDNHEDIAKLVNRMESFIKEHTDSLNKLTFFRGWINDTTIVVTLVDNVDGVEPSYLELLQN